MLDRDECLFVCDFIDTLKNSEVKRIPFNNNQYNRGITAMKEILEKDFPKEYKKLATLFCKRPISGDYARMEWALQQTMSSNRIAFMTPWDGYLYLKGPRDFSKKPEGMLKKITEIFCKETRIEIRTQNQQ